MTTTDEKLSVLQAIIRGLGQASTRYTQIAATLPAAERHHALLIGAKTLRDLGTVIDTCADDLAAGKTP